MGALHPREDGKLLIYFLVLQDDHTQCSSKCHAEQDCSANLGSALCYPLMNHHGD